MQTGRILAKMSQTTLPKDELLTLFAQKRELEKKVEYYRQEFKTARGKAKEVKKLLRGVNLRIKMIEEKDGILPRQ